MAKGGIVSVSFSFTNPSGSKLRPAEVLIEANLDLTVYFNTSQINWREATDILLSPTHFNGLKKQSLIRTGKIATIDKSLAKGFLGRLSSDSLADPDNKLKILFRLA